MYAHAYVHVAHICCIQVSTYADIVIGVCQTTHADGVVLHTGRSSFTTRREHYCPRKASPFPHLSSLPLLSSLSSSLTSSLPPSNSLSLPSLSSSPSLHLYCSLPPSPLLSLLPSPLSTLHPSFSYPTGRAGRIVIIKATIFSHGYGRPSAGCQV